MKSNFRRNSLANCSHPALRGFLFGNVQRQVKPPSMWAGRRKVPALTSAQGHCKSSTSSFTSCSTRVAVPMGSGHRVQECTTTTCQKIWITSVFGRIWVLRATFITSFAPKFLYFLFPLTSANSFLLSALLTSPRRCRDQNECRTSVDTASISKIMACSSIQDCLILKVVKNLLSLLCSELCSTISPTRNTQICFTKHLNRCSSKADNEALTCYLREAGFIRCAQTVLILTARKQHLLF